MGGGEFAAGEHGDHADEAETDEIRLKQQTLVCRHGQWEARQSGACDHHGPDTPVAYCDRRQNGIQRGDKDCDQASPRHGVAGADDAPEGGDRGHEQSDAGRVQQHEVPVRKHAIHEV